MSNIVNEISENLVQAGISKDTSYQIAEKVAPLLRKDDDVKSMSLLLKELYDAFEEVGASRETATQPQYSVNEGWLNGEHYTTNKDLVALKLSFVSSNGSWRSC